MDHVFKYQFLWFNPVYEHKNNVLESQNDSEAEEVDFVLSDKIKDLL